MKKLLLFLLLIVAALVSCTSVQPSLESPVLVSPSSTDASPSPTDGGGMPALATPVSEQPAAGICGGMDGEVVTITIFPDIPDPRCALVRPEQLLRVINKREEMIQISLAGIEVSVEPGQTYEFATPLGQLLAKGVHRVEVLPCCGAELWLRDTN
ncbi:MAG: hypothetical protein PVG14_10775 [Anaerolineales bacterium]